MKLKTLRKGNIICVQCGGYYGIFTSSTTLQSVVEIIKKFKNNH